MIFVCNVSSFHFILTVLLPADIFFSSTTIKCDDPFAGNATCVVRSFTRLDKLLLGVGGQYGAVYENFEKDIYGALEVALPQLSKYSTIKINGPANTYHPDEILKGGKKFCQQYAFNGKVVHNIANEPIKEGGAYINLMEDDLVILIEKILATKMKLGKHVGVISYNETPLKKLILNGITTISTDFGMMGEKAAELILEQSAKHVEILFNINIRASL